MYINIHLFALYVENNPTPNTRTPPITAPQGPKTAPAAAPPLTNKKYSVATPAAIPTRVKTILKVFLYFREILSEAYLAPAFLAISLFLFYLSFSLYQALNLSALQVFNKLLILLIPFIIYILRLL